MSSMETSSANIVILGVTGDLTAKKIMPALFNLWKKKALPEQCNIIGFGRREMDSPQFIKYTNELLVKKVKFSESEFKDFSKHLVYVQGLFEEQDSYKKLNTKLEELETGWNDPQRLFYLAVPPEIYGTIFTNLDSTGVGQGGTKKVLTKILVEKPFGKDQKTAEDLDKLLGALFKEHQIYRIDHYLAKEMVQNILAFRFANDIFEKIWDNQFIEKIEIRTWETLGVESRGAFYDAVGTFRDVGQNHLLQMLALATMDAPLDFSSQAVQLRRAQLIDTLRPLTEDEIKTHTYRAQYKGFTEIVGVKEGSSTETFFKIKLELNHPRWSGVPIYLEAGKRLSEQIKDVIITFKRDPNSIMMEGQRHTNRIIFRLEPEEAIIIEFVAKKPGLSNELEKRSFDFILRKHSGQVQYVEEYEKLLVDAARGDQTLFVSTAEVNAMWRFVDGVVAGWAAGLTELDVYKPGINPKPEIF
jgi:glucose-6-phosphate 1-dehydrogenase